MPTRAVVVDPDVAGRFVIREFADPQPLPNQAVVRVHAVSINRGEVRYSMSAPVGRRPGWDFAGVVEQTAADGTGPKVGARVVGILLLGSWAERVACPTNQLAEIPDNVTFAQASTLPVAVSAKRSKTSAANRRNKGSPSRRSAMAILGRAEKRTSHRHPHGSSESRRW